MLCTGFEASGLKEIEEVALFRSVACKHMHSAMLGGSLVVTMRNMTNPIFVLEARNVEREVLRGGVAVDVTVPLGMDPLLEILKVFGKDAGVGEDLGDIVEHRCVAVSGGGGSVEYG